MIKLLSVLYSEMEYNKLTVNNFGLNCFLLMMMHRCNNSSKFPRPLAATWVPMGLQQMGLISSFPVQAVLQQEEALYPMASPKSTPRSLCPGRFARMIQQLHWRASKMWTSCMHCKRKRRLHRQPLKTLQQTLQHPKTSLQGHTWVRRSGTSNRCNPSGTIELWPFHYCSVLCSWADLFLSLCTLIELSWVESSIEIILHSAFCIAVHHWHRWPEKLAPKLSKEILQGRGQLPSQLLHPDLIWVTVLSSSHMSYITYLLQVTDVAFLLSYFRV